MRSQYAIALVVALCLPALVNLGCDGPAPGVRWAPGEKQKQARSAATDLAELINRHGTPPGTPATRALVEATREAAADAGPPAEPPDVAALAPPAVLEAWSTRGAQVAALQRKLSTTYSALERSLARAPDLVSEINIDNPRQHLKDLADWFDDVGRSLEIAQAVEVPALPAMSEKEKAAASRVEQALATTIQQAEAAALRRPTVRETVERVSETANNTLAVGLGVLTALGLGGGGVATWLRRVKRAKDRAEQTSEVLVGQIASILKSPVAGAKINVADQSTTVGESIKSVLRAQPAKVQAEVDRIKRGN